MVIAKVTAHRKGGYTEPKHLQSPPSGAPAGYPDYEVLIGNGVVDVIEHRKMEPVFYTTDDPSIWRELEASSGG